MRRRSPYGRGNGAKELGSGTLRDAATVGIALQGGAAAAASLRNPSLDVDVGVHGTQISSRTAAEAA